MVCECAGGKLVGCVVALHVLVGDGSVCNVLHGSMAFDLSYLEVGLCWVGVEVCEGSGLLEWDPKVEVVGISFPRYAVSKVVCPTIHDVFGVACNCGWLGSCGDCMDYG